MKLKSKSVVFIIGCLSLAIISCKKFIQIDPPIDQITTETIFKDKETAVAAVNGLYSRMMDDNLYFLNGGISVLGGLSADEFSMTAPDIDLDPFYANSIPVTSSVIQSNLWRKAYTNIYQANLCLEGLAGSATLDNTTKTTLLGEMKVARALCYFYLVNLFGDVPLITTTNYEVNGSMGRTNGDAVYNQIIADLKEAKTSLGIAYPSSERVRPNKWVAAALLSRVYLYKKMWLEAEKEASDVIGSGTYTLVTPLANVFGNSSNETIWQLMPVLDLVNSAEGYAYIPVTTASRKPKYALTNSLLAAFETGDQRKVSWIGSKNVSGQITYYPFKYRVRTGSPKTEYNIVLRLAEQYLIRAEAKAQQNRITEAVADLNIIRSRAGLATFTGTTVISLLSAIENERRVELFSEWGHRWLDVKRTGKADSVFSVSKPSWQSWAALYPIPQPELLLNRNLVQNPGY